MKKIIKIFTGLSFIVFSFSVNALGTLIPAPDRIDMSHDLSRNLVYISSGAQVLRYDLATDTFLTPYTLSGSLSGMDISPDGHTLAVADRMRGETEVWVHLIDLNTGVSTKAIFPRAFAEGGTFTVSYAADGSLLVTSTFEGSGWVPLRRYEAATDTTLVLGSVRQNTMLSASADANTIAFAESNSSAGPMGRYNVLSQLLENGPGTSWFNFEIATNHNGSHYSVPTYGGTFIYDQSLSLLDVIGTYAGPQPVGAVYHPVENRVYYPWATTVEVKEFDTVTNTEVASYNFEHTFSHTGNHAFGQGRMKISSDGSLLMATVTGGVRVVKLYDGLTASNQSVTLDEDTSANIVLNAAIGNGGALTYNIISAPSLGVLSGDAATMVYTPDADAFGLDSFTYVAQYGGASVQATVSIVINPVNDAPLAVDDIVATANRTIDIAVLQNDLDVDGDAFSITAVSSAVNGGRVIISADGQTINFRFKNRRISSDSFDYTITDVNGSSSVATVTVNSIK